MLKSRTDGYVDGAFGADVRRITVLGSTGSIGRNTLDLIRDNNDRYEIEALTAHRNVQLLIEQAREFRPRAAIIADEAHYDALKDALAGTGIEVGAGRQALVEAAERPAEWLMAGIVGAAGLPATLRAVKRGATVALANKECLVCAGDIFMREVGSNGATLLPVDSEHNAIFQVFDFERHSSVERIILTASGGPFRTWTRAEMAEVTPEQAVAHPNWDMGAKISVDSATMMNKGLEMIEAYHLFPVEEPQIDVLVHPQSVVHSMVAYEDGSVLAQLGSPDMRTPISYALGWPERIATPARRLDLTEISNLSFERPDPDRFPALRLAREALKSGGGTPTILNAANEVAVEGFLHRRIDFLAIAQIVENVLGEMETGAVDRLEDVFELDSLARQRAHQQVERLMNGS